MPFSIASARVCPAPPHLAPPPAAAPLPSRHRHAQAFDAFFEPELVKKLSEGPLTQLDQTFARSESGSNMGRQREEHVDKRLGGEGEGE